MKISPFAFLLTATLLVSCGGEQEAEVASTPTSTESADAATPAETAASPVGTTAPSASSSLEFSDFRTGDVVFQVSMSDQGRAIRLATGSMYTHCGIIAVNEVSGEVFVIEAYKAVQRTPLKTWLKRGKEGRYLVRRHSNSDELFTERNKKWLAMKIREWGDRPYDPYFEWTDDRMYCSELVFKLYKELEVELVPLQQLKSYDLTSDEVKAKMDERYGNDVPLEEWVVAPSDLVNTDQLFTVHQY